jgi:leucyl aminopeptidase
MRIHVLKAADAGRDPRPLALLVFEDEKFGTAPSAGLPPDCLRAARARIERAKFKGEMSAFMHLLAGDRELLLIGAGPRAEIAPARLRRIGGQLAVESRRLGLRAIDIRLPRQAAPHARALATGLAEGGYALREGRTRGVEDARLVIDPDIDTSPLAREADRGAHVGAEINAIREIANRPGNEAPPRVIAREAQALARRCGLACSVWDRRRLEAERCRAFLAVAAGSRQEPCLIHLRYPGRDRRLRPLVVIGKTITFDTGGISIKPAKNMEGMKFDKSGGMAALAFMALVGAVLKPDRPVIGLLAAAENMPGGGATRPGDVVRSRNGKTIEIVNTDAEGRLVLADAIDVALEYDPAGLIDLATLTGAATVALGRPYSALLSNNAPLRESLQAAGEASGDRVWPLPLHPDYKALLKSPFADIKNIGDGSAGTIIGGIFLESFVPAHVPWAHIDLTSAWEERATPYGPAGATIFGAALLAQWVDSGGMEALSR